MNDYTLDCMLSGINALDLNTSEVFNDNQNKLNTVIRQVVRQQMNNLALEDQRIKHAKIDSMGLLKPTIPTDESIGIRGTTPVRGSYGYTVVDDLVSTNQSYFDSLREKLCIAKTNKIVKGDLNIKTLVADLLKFCSDEEIDELIARITSDSEYLSRKGYNSINLKGD